MREIQLLEVELQQFATRSNADRINQLIHEDFFEIGYSGTQYNKTDIMNSLLQEKAPEYSVWSQNFEFVELAENLVQVIYKEAQMDKAGHLSRHAIRTSIWKKVQGHWQVQFHQATPISSFEKLKYTTLAYSV